MPEMEPERYALCSTLLIFLHIVFNVCLLFCKVTYEGIRLYNKSSCKLQRNNFRMSLSGCTYSVSHLHQAIACPAQINPRFLLQYRKLPKTQLLNMSREVTLLGRTHLVFSNFHSRSLSHLGGPYVSNGIPLFHLSVVILLIYK